MSKQLILQLTDDEFVKLEQLRDRLRVTLKKPGLAMTDVLRNFIAHSTTADSWLPPSESSRPKRTKTPLPAPVQRIEVQRVDENAMRYVEQKSAKKA